jgi:hypothetical protein
VTPSACCSPEPRNLVGYTRSIVTASPPPLARPSASNRATIARAGETQGAKRGAGQAHARSLARTHARSHARTLVREPWHGLDAAAAELQTCTMLQFAARRGCGTAEDSMCARGKRRACSVIDRAPFLAAHPPAAAACRRAGAGAAATLSRTSQALQSG